MTRSPLRPSVVLGIAWLYVIVYAFPGQMTPDSFDHLGDARLGIYTDVHPPIIDLLFDLIDHIAPIPLTILVAQATAFLLGLYAILLHTFSASRAAWIAAAVFVFPPVLSPMVAVWKDSLMPALLVLGIAGMLSERGTRRIAALVALFGATAVRYNAFAATLPLVVLLFEVRRGMHWLVRYPLALVTWLAITAAAFWCNSQLADQEMHFWQSSIAAHDIAGTFAHLDGELPDHELERLLDGTDLRVHDNIHARIRAAYTPKSFLPLVASDQALWKLPVYGHESAPETQRDAITRAWREVVNTYPRAYIRHRIAVMGQVLSLTRGRPADAVLRRDFLYPLAPVEAGTGTHWSRVQLALTDALVALWKNTPLFTPWMYLAIAVLLMPLAVRQRDVLALLVSGLVFEAMLLPLAPTPDYRYSHWMVLCTCLAIVLLVARRYRHGAWLRPAATNQHTDASQAIAQ